MRISCDIPDWIIETILRQLVEQVGTQIHTTRTNILDRPARSFPLPQRLGYTVRIGNMIRNWEEVRTVEDLCRRNEAEFKGRKGGGPRARQFLREALAAEGLRFGMTDHDFDAFRRGEFKL
jgi:hypothetical protein